MIAILILAYCFSSVKYSNANPIHRSFNIQSGSEFDVNIFDFLTDTEISNQVDINMAADNNTAFGKLTGQGFSDNEANLKSTSYFTSSIGTTGGSFGWVNQVGTVGRDEGISVSVSSDNFVYTSGFVSGSLKNQTYYGNNY